MSDEKYIKSLFDAARNEQPELSFEETSKTFKDALRSGRSETVKDWLFNRISLNSILLVSALGIIFSAAFWGEPKEPQPITTTTFTTEITDTQTIENDSISPIKVTVETENETVEISLKGDPTDIRIEKFEKFINPKSQKGNDDELSQIDTSNLPLFDTIYEIADLDLDEPSKIEKPIKIVSIDDLKKEKNIKPANIVSSSNFDRSGYKKTAKIRSDNTVNFNKTTSGKMSELEKVVDLSLNLEHLDHVFKRNRTDGFDQLMMVTNEIFDHRINVFHRGKKVIIAPRKDTHGFQPLSNYVDVKTLNITQENAYFKFFYGARIIEIILKKQNGQWFFEQSSIDEEKGEVGIEEDLIQKALNVEYLKKVFKKDASDNYLPLVIFTNGYFSKGVDVYFDEKRVPVFFNEKQSKQSIESPVINVTKFKRKRKKIDFEFNYGNAKISIEMKRKKDKKWYLRSISHKEPGKVYSNVNF